MTTPKHRSDTRLLFWIFTLGCFGVGVALGMYFALLLI